jgi:hypothetical protein
VFVGVFVGVSLLVGVGVSVCEFVGGGVAPPLRVVVGVTVFV